MGFVFTLVVLALSWREVWLTDDALITFRYVDHWLAGKGLVFNLGERVEGFSNPLFVFVLAALRVLGVSSQRGAEAIGLAATAGECALLVALLWRLRVSPWAASVALAAHGLDRVVHVWATGGLETSLHALLVTACLAVVLVPSWRRFGAVALVLVSVSRPEGVALALVAGMALVLTAPRDERRRTAVGLLNVVVPVLALFVLARFLYYGELLPNTFRAKVDGALTRGFGVGYLGAFLRRLGLLGWGAIPALGLGALAALRRPGLHAIALGVAGALVATQLAFVVAVGGDYLCDFRFVRPALGPLAIVVACAVDRALEPGGAKALVALLCGAGVSAARIAGSLAGTPIFYDAPIATEHKRMLTVTLAEADRYRAALAKVAVPGDTQVVDKAGMTGFGHDVRTLDSTGLLSKDVARDFEPRGDFVEDGRRERFPGHLRYPRVEFLQRERVALLFPRVSTAGPDVPEIRASSGKRRREYPFVHVVAPLDAGESLRFFSALSEDALEARATLRGVTLCLRRPFGAVRCVGPD